jgi:hypothetical protein
MSDEIASELCFVDSNVWLYHRESYSLSHWVHPFTPGSEECNWL